MDLKSVDFETLPVTTRRVDREGSVGGESLTQGFSVRDGSVWGKSIIGLTYPTLLSHFHRSPAAFFLPKLRIPRERESENVLNIHFRLLTHV